MKNYLLIASICLMIVACSKSNVNNNCGYLENRRVDFPVNLNFPQFSDLQNDFNSVYVPNQGNGGVIVTSSPLGRFGILAWDAADPNHIFNPINPCSIMTIVGETIAKCNCADANEYSLNTGQILNDTLPCGLTFYNVEQTGNNTYYISN